MTIIEDQVVGRHGEEGRGGVGGFQQEIQEIMKKGTRDGKGRGEDLTEERGGVFIV